MEILISTAAAVIVAALLVLCYHSGWARGYEAGIKSHRRSRRATIMLTLNETKSYYVGVNIKTFDADNQPVGSQTLHGVALKLSLADVQNNAGTLVLDESVDKWRLDCGDVGEGPASATITGTYDFGEEKDVAIDGDGAFELTVGDAVTSHGSFSLEEVPTTPPTA